MENLESSARHSQFLPACSSAPGEWKTGDDSGREHPGPFQGIKHTHRETVQLRIFQDCSAFLCGRGAGRLGKAGRAATWHLLPEAGRGGDGKGSPDPRERFALRGVVWRQKPGSELGDPAKPRPETFDVRP